MNINDKVERLIRPEVRQSTAYSVPDSAGFIKLDAMENPYRWPPEVIDRWLEVLRDVPLNRYPDPGAPQLKRRLREAMAIPPSMGVLLGNGSDELIQILLMALAQPESRVLAPTPTFVMYEIIAKAVGMDFIPVPLGADFALDTPALCAAIEEHRPAVTFLACPNNPTGNVFAADDVEALIRHSDGLVVIDEAYFAFTDVTFLEHLERYDNLLVLRTLSKLGLAGLRLGFLVGNRRWLNEFDKLRLPYNINSLTQASAEFALTNRGLLDEQVTCIRAEREQLFLALDSIPGIRAWPSETNFILFQLKRNNAQHVWNTLYSSGVLVKNLDSAGDALQGCLRVTVGTPAENRAFLNALRAAV